MPWSIETCGALIVAHVSLTDSPTAIVVREAVNSADAGSAWRNTSSNHTVCPDWLGTMSRTSAVFTLEDVLKRMALTEEPAVLPVLASVEIAPFGSPAAMMRTVADDPAVW